MLEFDRLPLNPLVLWAIATATPSRNQSSQFMSTMVVNKIKKLLLLSMIAWLPLAGAIVAAMPLAAMKVATRAAAVASVGDQGTSLMPCHVKAVQVKNSGEQGCTDCVLCHLAGALMAAEMPVIAVVAPTNIFVVKPSIKHLSFVAEPTAPPPRRSLA